MNYDEDCIAQTHWKRRVYLSESKSLRMLTLCGLYVAQGVPWGFVTITFAAWLAAPKHQLTTAEIGPILAVASLPWSFKFVWGPLMDRFTIRSMGRRRPWILFAQSMAILLLASLLFFDDLPGMVWTKSPSDSAFWSTFFTLVPGPLAALILVANIFVSMQDVAVDALAVDLLEEKERGIANGLMYGCSYLGTAIGGSGLGALVAAYGIRAGLIGQAGLLFVIMLLPLFLRERRPAGKLGAPDSKSTSHRMDLGESPYLPPTVDDSADISPEPESQHSIVSSLIRAFSLRATLLGAVVAIGVKIGIGVLTAVFVSYLMQEGGWTQGEYTSFIGGYAVMLGLVGSGLGGWLADKVGAKPMIVLSSVMLGILWIGFGLFPSAVASRPMVKGMLLGQEFLFAVLSVCLFSLFMSISWPRVAATQFTSYMALMNLSATIGSYTAGRLSLSYSVFELLIIAGVVQMLMVAPVLLIDPTQTRRVLGNQ